jgi:hypothetical protein
LSLYYGYFRIGFNSLDVCMIMYNRFEGLQLDIQENRKQGDILEIFGVTPGIYANHEFSYLYRLIVPIGSCLDGIKTLFQVAMRKASHS